MCVTGAVDGTLTEQEPGAFRNAPTSALAHGLLATR